MKANLPDRKARPSATAAAPARLPLRVKVRNLLVQIVVISLITVGLLEALVALSFRYPRWSPVPSSLVQYLHIRFDRNVIQVMPDCAIYDATLTYTLRPGRCVFASREFSNEYRINSLGVRDDEASLSAPHTVMLGDSLTMGWGVDEERSFPAVFEKLSGLRTLNAGVSSYGTVRELRLLERIDRTALKHLIIQYNQNDAFENRESIEHPPLRILSKPQYERTIAEQARLLRYFPGKYAFNVVVQLRSMLRRGGTEPNTANIDIERQAQLFLEVLQRSAVDVSQLSVTVLCIDSRFIEAARRAVATSAVKWVRELQFVDAGSIMSLEGAFYRLDDHPTAVGHDAIARLLVRHLGSGS